MQIVTLYDFPNSTDNNNYLPLAYSLSKLFIKDSSISLIANVNPLYASLQIVTLYDFPNSTDNNNYLPLAYSLSKLFIKDSSISLIANIQPKLFLLV